MQKKEIKEFGRYPKNRDIKKNNNSQIIYLVTNNLVFLNPNLKKGINMSIINFKYSIKKIQAEMKLITPKVQ